MSSLNDSTESSVLEFPVQKTVPLHLRDCRVLTAILDKISAFDHYNAPNRSVVAWIAEVTEMDEDDVGAPFVSLPDAPIPNMVEIEGAAGSPPSGK
ncbi:hypothetical protein, partial [Tunturiibacter psychrotolerans]